MAKPVVGITTYLTPASFGVWETTAVLVPQSYVLGVEQAGGRALLVPPSEDGIEETLDALDGLIFSGGSDLDPDLYGQEPHRGDERDRSRARPGRAGAAERRARARPARAGDLPRLAGPERRSRRRPDPAPAGSRRARAAQGDRPASSRSTRSRSSPEVASPVFSAPRSRSSRTTTRATPGSARGCAYPRATRTGRSRRSRIPRAGSRSAFSGTPRQATTCVCSRRSCPKPRLTGPRETKSPRRRPRPPRSCRTRSGSRRSGSRSGTRGSCASSGRRAARCASERPARSRA